MKNTIFKSFKNGSIITPGHNGSDFPAGGKSDFSFPPAPA